MGRSAAILNRLRRKGLWWKAGVPLLVLAVAAWLFWPGKGPVAQRGTTFAAVKGDLKITVIEGGSVSALESQDIVSEVQGQTKILSIVEEGYNVTREDVDNKKILVELDSKELVERQTEQELQYQNASAGYTEATKQYEIQINQNESDIKKAELDAKFARMDLEKYLGALLAGEIIRELGITPYLGGGEIETPVATVESSELEQPGQALPEGGPEAPVEAPVPSSTGEPATAPAAIDPEELRETQLAPKGPEVDFSVYASPDRLGDGEARQKLRKLEDDLLIARRQLTLSQTTLEGTRRLAERDFVTKNDLEKDEMTVQKDQVSLESAETSQELFIKYEFPKEAEKFLSTYQEALRQLERSLKLAMAKLAQAEAKWKSAEAQFKLQETRRREIQDQIDKCTIRAERVGMVVYGGSDEPWHNEEQIQEGATVRERQKIITIPDMTTMAVEVKIHESAIKKIAKGQKATIRVDAYPDEMLTGEVFKVGILPDAGNRWMNPDVKVYNTSIRIDGTQPWMKPGMSAQVEIMVEELNDVIYVPVQAVSAFENQRVCYVVSAGWLDVDKRPVQTGKFSEEFIEIKEGLREGDRVLLRTPVVTTEQPEGKGPEDGKPKDRKDGPRGEKKQDEERPPRDNAQEAPAEAPAPTETPSAEGSS